ncbi:MAG: hypothetical protein RBR86_09115 [Pseudobdellovibrionaceae bacterium]|jgi:hypothetical protein|nr:hypothetical protein [Pseudobdellovibrionaceae bacterium]
MTGLKELFCGATGDGYMGIGVKGSDLGMPITTVDPLKVTPGSGQKVEAPAILTDATGEHPGRLFIDAAADTCTFKVQNQIFGGIKAPLADPKAPKAGR